MELQLDLSRHCIETELKRQHNRAVSDYFKAGPREKLLVELIIEMVRSALETLDFARLRDRYRALRGGTHCKIVLSCDHANLFITIDGQRLKLLDRI
jgi:hypothetical protein